MSLFASTQRTPIADMFDAIAQGAVVSISLDKDDTFTSLDRNRFIECVADTDQLARLHGPGNPPPLCTASAWWAAQTMYFFLRILLNRIETDVSLPLALAETEPSGEEASHHWSVDLVFRVLPDLDRRCSAVNSLDPLRQTIRQVAERWPLSAIGIDGEFNPKAKAVLLAEHCLRSELLDRVFAHANQGFTKSSDETVRWPELNDELLAMKAAIEIDRSADLWR